MNRLVFRQLSEERTRDALGLINIGQWSGAYYLTGYAVECGLKACIARKTAQDDYPDKEFAIKCYTHRIEVLVELAGLDGLLTANIKANPLFKNHWLIIKAWDERARYKLWSDIEAHELYDAATDPNDGVLSWIKAHW